MKKSIMLLSAFGVILLLQNCTKAVIDEPSTVDLPPITRIVKYNPEVASISFNHCLTCHAGSAPSGSLDLSSYDSFRQQMESGDMWQRLNNSTDPMPPSGVLPATTLQIIEKWAADGYPQN